MVSDVAVEGSEIGDGRVIGGGDGGQIVAFLDLVRQDDFRGAAIIGLGGAPIGGAGARDGDGQGLVGEDEVVVCDPAHVSDVPVCDEARVDGIGDAGERVVVDDGVY